MEKSEDVEAQDRQMLLKTLLGPLFSVTGE